MFAQFDHLCTIKPIVGCIVEGKNEYGQNLPIRIDNEMIDIKLGTFEKEYKIDWQ